MEKKLRLSDHLPAVHMPDYDVIIVGAGVAGLYTALKLPSHYQVLLVSKDCLEKSNSSLAQGGICVLKDDSDYMPYYQDTLKAGHYKNNPHAVELMIQSSRPVIQDLISYGVDFDKNEDGSFSYTKEGAHTASRILHYRDCTGREITQKLIARVQQLNNIKILANTKLIDLVHTGKECRGVVIKKQNGFCQALTAGSVVLATGGIGGLFPHSTNYRQIRGDSFALALKYGIQVENLNYIQIHPTAFYSARKGRRFLISESVRGEGGILLNEGGKRFVDELKPRDMVSDAIYSQLKESGKPYVYLSLAKITKERIVKRFPNIYQHCLEAGIDITREKIPVTPAQHYLMGGIRTNTNGETSLPRLYAVGETACNGVHGANRLASNSLLESLVFAGRTAARVSAAPNLLYMETLPAQLIIETDDAKRNETFKNLIMDEIRRKDEIFYDRWCNP